MKFTFRKTIPVPRETVFAFFKNPRCLRFLHEREPHIRVLRHGGSVIPGCETWAEVIAFKILPVILGFRHDLYDPPVRFGENIIHGPFTKFVHIHEFLPARGGTEIVDHLEICLPFHYGGEIAVRWLIARTVNASFALRHRALDVLASNGVLASCAKENLDYDRRELSSVSARSPGRD